MSSDLETSVGRKCFWARCQDGSPLIRGGFLEEASRVWKGRVLADLKRRNMKVLCTRPHQAFSRMFSLGDRHLSPFIGEEMGPEGKSKLIKVPGPPSFEKTCSLPASVKHCSG